jgi:hypothetical protein
MRQAELEPLLPGVFQQGLVAAGPMRVVLLLMERMHEPSERILEDLDRYFDPRRTADPFVPYLADWLGLSWLHAHPDAPETTATRMFPTGLGRLGEVVARTRFHTRWRGTRPVLLRFLETATGLSGYEITEEPDAEGRTRPYHFQVRVPPGAVMYHELIERIVAHEKPAHVTYEIATAEGEQ